jgi:hypothetical protein
MNNVVDRIKKWNIIVELKIKRKNKYLVLIILIV